MRSSTLVSLLMLAGGFASGCGDGDTLGTNGGAGGGPYGTGGLRQGEGGGASGAGTDCVPGALGCSCYGNDTCDAQLRCEDGVCNACEVGTLGCSCYRNGTCDDGLTCQSDLCEPHGTGGGGGALAGSGGSGGSATGGTGGPGTPVGATGGTSAGGLGGAVTGGTGSGGEGGVELGGAAGESGNGGQPPVPGCGNGFIDTFEACDDGNADAGDGCSSACRLEEGWQCRVPGRDCVPYCGDGSIVAGREGCDDGNAISGDGCSSTCSEEPGWDCGTAMPSVCTRSCGNGVQEPGESCDQGAENGLFYGDPANPGCSKTCTLEPSCRTGGVTGACQIFCGDGNIDVGEACDDGNAFPGDGCDATCRQEAGFACETIEEPDTEPCSSGGGECLMLPVIYRDFDGQNVNGGHPDFFYLGASVGSEETLCVPNASGDPDPVTSNCSSSDSTERCTGLVLPTLSAQGKPQFNPAKNGMCECRFTDRDARDIITAANGQACTDEEDGSTRYRVGFDSVLNVPVMHSAATFGQWYSDSSYSTAVRGTLELEAIAGGVYQFSSSDGDTVNDDIHAFCDNERSATLSSGFFPLEDQARDKTCNIWPYWESGLKQECCAGKSCPVQSQWDPDVNYGTCDPGDGGALPYDTGEITGMLRNFYFTTEVRYLFRYGGSGGTLAFFGDDDVWVFVNGQLALDLGGTHERLEGSVNINGATFGLEEGRIYEIAVFHADQHPRESNYQLTLTSFATQRSECVPQCGDGVATLTEQCDLGAENADDTYGGCRTDCTPGPYCGDGELDAPEECDHGAANGSVYGSQGDCSTACRRAHFCGDGFVDTAFGEACDDGGPSADCTDTCTEASP